MDIKKEIIVVFFIVVISSLLFIVKSSNTRTGRVTQDQYEIKSNGTDPSNESIIPAFNDTGSIIDTDDNESDLIRHGNDTHDNTTEVAPTRYMGGGGSGGSDSSGSSEDSCSPELISTTCGTWMCGSKVNNCGDNINCGTCDSDQFCSVGLCYNNSYLSINSCKTLGAANQEYELNGNINNNTLKKDCIIINATRITLDCKNNSINVSFANSGIFSNKDSTIIKNCNIFAGNYGIFINNSNNVRIINNTINNNSEGLYIFNSRLVSITGNYVNYNNDTGLKVWNVSDANISNNNLCANRCDVVESNGDNSIFVNNSCNDTGIFGGNCSACSITGSECTIDTECDDGVFCNGVETCSNGWCRMASVSPETSNMSDGIPCTYDHCDEDIDGIVHSVNNTFCDDGVWCNGDETCNATLGCQKSATRETGDNISCTIDSCDENNDMILHNPDSTLCAPAHSCDASLGCIFNSSMVININSCQELNISRGVYNLDSDIENNSLTTHCMRITAESVTLDCKEKRIRSNNQVSGIYSDKKNTTVANCDVTMSDNPGGTGIQIRNTTYAEIINNTLNSQNRGTYLNGNVTNSLIQNNIINQNTEKGLHIHLSSQNIIRDNTFDSGINYGIHSTKSSNNYYINNLLDSNLWYGLFIEQSGDENPDGNNFIINNTIRSSYYNAYIKTSDNVIENNLITSCAFSDGLYIYEGNNTIIIDNEITNNFGSGLKLTDSFNNTIINNNLELNDQYGIDISGVSENNNISENRICSNTIDVSCTIDQIFGVTNYCSIASVCGGSCISC